MRRLADLTLGSGVLCWAMRPFIAAAVLLLAPLAFTMNSGCSAGSRAKTGDEARVTPADFRPLVGPIWTGTLTYRDYTTGNPTVIKSALKVEPVEGETSAWYFRMHYPDEPSHNSNGIVRLASDGRKVDDEMVMERERLGDGSVRIVTEKDGEDNSKPMRLRYVYTFGSRECSIQKLTRGAEDAGFAERNMYKWTR